MSPSLLKKSSYLIVFTMISRSLGLVREMVKASFLGTTALADAFSIAFLIPNLFRRLFAEGTMSAAFIPTLRGYLNDSGEKGEEVRLFLSSFLTLLTLLLTVTVSLGMFFSPQLVMVFGPSLPGSSFPEAVHLTTMMFIYLGFISLAAFFQGMLNTEHIFAPSGFTPILFNLSFISSAFLLTPYTENPARALAIGIIVGGALQAAFQLPWVIKNGFRFSLISPLKAFRHPGSKKVFRLIAPTILGMGAYQLNIIISTRIASGAGVGVVTSLQYSNRLLELLLGVFIVSLGTVVLPQLTAHVKKKEWAKYGETLSFALKLTAFITLPATAFALLFRTEIVAVLFLSGKFSTDSVNMTAVALLFHMPGLFFIAINRMLYPAFYARENTITPTIAGVLSLGTNIVFAYLLVGSMKGGGVALASTIAAVVSSLYLAISLIRKKALSVGMVHTIFSYAARMLLFAAAGIVPVLFLKPLLFAFFSGSGGKIISIGIPLTLSFLLYFFAVVAVFALAKDESFLIVYGAIKRRIPWKK
ncbi:murein biosynthesis integral membrane protein MurJ [bacterium]|nr:murein biosynthesis integral membrane protein MurJ [bacterium]